MVKHLPPSLKVLLAQRNPAPFRIAGSSVSHALKTVLARTRAEAVERCGGAVNGWLVLSTCTLLTANTPTAVGDLYRFASTEGKGPSAKPSIDARLLVAAKMREAALKSSIFVGVPRTILSLAAMHEAFEEDVKGSLRSEPVGSATPENIEESLRRGQALWKSIYAPHDEKLYNKLGSYHPDFITFIIQAYGFVLSPSVYPAAFAQTDNPMGNLSRTLGSVVGSACLRAETRVGPQLVSHVFGLLKARNEEWLSKEDAWLSSDEGAEWVIRSVDQIRDVVRGEGEWEEEMAVKLKL